MLSVSCWLFIPKELLDRSSQDKLTWLHQNRAIILIRIVQYLLLVKNKLTNKQKTEQPKQTYIEAIE